MDGPLGRTHVDLNEDEEDFLLGSIEERSAFYEALDKTHRHITPQVCQNTRVVFRGECSI